MADVNLLTKWEFEIEAIRSDLSSSSKLTLMLLLNHFNNQTGRCDPSVAGLAAQLRVHKTTTIAAIAELETKGWISIERRHGARSTYIPCWRKIETGSADTTGSNTSKLPTGSAGATTTSRASTTATGSVHTTRTQEKKTVKEHGAARFAPAAPSNQYPSSNIPALARAAVAARQPVDDEFAKYLALTATASEAD